MEASEHRKLCVEVVKAHNWRLSVLSFGARYPKAFCTLEYDGQKKSTREVLDCTNPSWNEKFEFVIKSITRQENLEIYCHIYPYIGLESCLRVTIPVCDVPLRLGWDGFDEKDWGLCPQDVRNLKLGYLRLRIWIEREDRELQSILRTLPQVPSHTPNFSRSTEGLMEGEGSSSAYINPVRSNPFNNPFLPGPSYDPHDGLHEPANPTNLLESMEGETEQVINERMMAREVHLQKVKDLVNAHQSHVVEAFELEARTESQIHERLPLCASQLVAQSLQRTQSMAACKQTLEIFGIQNHLIPSIENAMNKEREVVQGATYAARAAVRELKQLRDGEQIAFKAYLTLMEKQKNERMEHFKKILKEKERRLNTWADRRRETLKILQGIESNSQVLLQQLNTLVEPSQTTREYTRESEAEVCQAFERAAIEDTSSSSNLSVCQICCNYLEGPSSGTSPTGSSHDVKQRSCLIPCLHAMICLPCATRIWESTKECPFCKVTLTTKPRPLYLG